ncbi:MAG: vanadium-dependent haloperoxidase [Saprospiraceae bacterium]
MNNRKLLLLFTSLTLLTSVFITGCKEEDPIAEQKLVADFPAEASLKWNKLFHEIERYASGYRPGPAPRALGLMGLAAYEACVTGMPDYNSLENQFNGLNIPNVEAGAEYHWPTVIHGVYSIMMPKFFDQVYPTSVVDHWQAMVNQLNQKYQGEASTEVYNRSKAYGESVGLAVWEWSTTDPYGHNAYKNPFGNFETNETYNYQDHYDGPGDWEPHAPGPTSPMGPFFGKARTFVLKEADKLSLPPTAYFMEYSEDVHSEYYSQALQTYTKNAATDYVVEWIGEFWSDDLLNLTFSPGPRWIAIGNQIIEKDNVDLERALEAYAKTGMALNDAAVGCWNSKYYYNVERPVTYIKKIIDPTFKANLDNPITGDIGFTPPFPAYPSGHSTMGGAGAEALASVFGYSYAMTDNCHLNRTEFEGVPRTFGSLHEMAVENAWSRVLLGVHWKMDCDEGVRYGTVIGRKVNALPWKK